MSYLSGEGSLDDIALKYNIPSSKTLHKWVNYYNGHIELKDYIPGDNKIYMTKKHYKKRAITSSLVTTL